MEPEINKGGRPRFEPTVADRNIVKNLCAAGLREEAICLNVLNRGKPIAPKTLRKYFAQELAISKNEVTAMCMSNIVKAINAGEAWACCFWMKCRAGWKERSALDDVEQVVVKRVIGVPDDEI